MQPRPPGPGSLLVATPHLSDPNFSRSVVLLLQHDEEGSLGVVLDRPTAIPVGEFLPAWEPMAVEPAVVFHGGPVQPEIGIGLRIRFGALEIVDLLAGPEDESPVRVFAGCAGWSTGQLEDELAEEAWFVVDFQPSDLLSDTPEGLWAAVLRRQEFELAIFSTHPRDPRMN